jgi:hypothetical protein
LDTRLEAKSVMSHSRRVDYAAAVHTNTRHSIVLTSLILSNPVPVNSSAIDSEIVLDIYNDPIAPLRAKSGPRIHPINQHHRSISTAAIWIWNNRVRYFEVVLYLT